MTTFFESEVQQPHSATNRLLLILFGASLMGLLLIALCLQPADSGYGTHRQLGLPPCGFQMIYGKPCPSCGMTTSWAYLMRGQLVKSCQSNAGGMLLGLLALSSSVWMLYSGIQGRWLGGVPHPLWIAGLVMLIILVIAINWILQLAG